MSTRINKPLNESVSVSSKAHYSAVVTGGGAVLEKSHDDFMVERMEEGGSPINKYRLSWVTPISNEAYDVTAAPNFKYSYAVPHAGRTETSCELVFFNSSQTELITNFSCSVIEF